MKYSGLFVFGENELRAHGRCRLEWAPAAQDLPERGAAFRGIKPYPGRFESEIP